MWPICGPLAPKPVSPTTGVAAMWLAESEGAPLPKETSGRPALSVGETSGLFGWGGKGVAFRRERGGCGVCGLGFGPSKAAPAVTGVWCQLENFRMWNKLIPPCSEIEWGAVEWGRAAWSNRRGGARRRGQERPRWLHCRRHGQTKEQNIDGCTEKGDTKGVPSDRMETLC
jgi:hypothetical protein